MSSQKKFINKISNILKFYFLPLISGVLIGTSYIPFPPWAVMFCLTPLWWFSLYKAENLTQIFWGGWLTQFIFNLIGFHWIAHTVHEFGQMPWPISILLLLVFASLAHLHVPLSIVVARWLAKSRSLSGEKYLWTLPLSFFIFERLFPMMFPWNLGYTLLWAKIPIFQWADIVGFEGLSLLILLTNAWCMSLALRYKSDPNLNKTGLMGLITVVLLFGLLYGGKYYGQKQKTSDSELLVGAIQANIGNMEKIYAEKGQGYQEHILNQYMRLSQQALANNPNIKLLIWPETAFADYLDAAYLDKPLQTKLKDFVNQINIPILTGSYSKDSPEVPAESRKTYNGVFLVQPGSQVSPPYRKNILLAFGEYLPGSYTFPALLKLKLTPMDSNFGTGNGPAVIPFQSIQLAPLICYEGLHPSFVAETTLKGAQILINLTNDSWFGTTFEPKQHLVMTLARAVEFRLPLVRVTNTGITSVGQADGSWTKPSPTNQEWTGAFRVKYQQNPKPTWYARGGHLIIYLVCLAFVTILFWGVWRERTKKSRLAGGQKFAEESGHI